MLSFEKMKNSKPIAVTKKQQIIYINDISDIPRDRKNEELYDYIPEQEIQNIIKKSQKVNKKISKSQMKELEKSLIKKIEPEHDVLGHLYKDIDSKLNDKMKREIILKDYDDSMEILPSDISERLYFCGPSGSGKSYSMSTYIKNFKKIFPKTKIFLISDQPEDEQLDKFNPVRILINEELLDDPIQVEELKNSLIVFDDIDSITNKELKKQIETLRDTILKRGRHFNEYCLTSNHQCTEFFKTREILSSANKVFVYPQSGSSYSIKYMLNKYIGLSKEQIQKIFDLKSRWVCICKVAPMWIMYDHGVYLLD